MSFLRRAGLYVWTLLTNLYFWGGLALLVLLALGAYLVFDNAVMPGYTRYGVSVTVPDVAGVDAGEARDRLEERDLRVETLQETFNPSVERGAVIEQNPRGGRSVKPGRRIYLTVNTGEQPTVGVPDVVDRSLREARNQLQSRGFVVGEVREDTIPSPYEGTVTRQEPAAGDSLTRGTSVSLWYSGGLSDARSEVPEVTGQTVEEARRALMGRKLRAVVVRPARDDATGDDSDDRLTQQDALSQQALDGMEVTRQGREAGASVQQGTEIRLYVGGDGEGEQ